MYKILAEVDLSNYLKYGKSWLYNTLKNLHKDVYADNERIIFYLDQPDIYEYSDNVDQGEIETQLDIFLKEIDIPDYFVIKKISKEKNINTNYNTKCILPWLQFHSGPTGDIVPCCLIENSFGNIADFNDVVDSMNSEKFKKLRLDMLNNKKNRECKNCYEQEKNGVKSERLRINNEYRYIKEKFFQNTQKDGSIKHFPKLLSIGLDSVCNFKCRMCYYELSSRIEDEDIKLGLLKEKSVKIKNTESYKNFINDIIQNISDIEYIHFWGGEPLLHNDHYLLLDELIKVKNFAIFLAYHTNLNLLNYKKKYIVDYWNMFKNIRVTVSLDAAGKKGEYIRHGSNYQQTVDNLLEIKKKSPHIILKIDSAVTIYNLLCVTDLHKEIIDKKILDCENINIEFGYGELNDMRMLPIHLKHQAENKIQEFIQYISNFENSQSLIFKYKNLIKYMYSTDLSYNLSKFINQVRIRDQFRNENLFETFPELIDLKEFDKPL